jgi:glycosyltransferase involved in cell wall biosynthesis
LVKELKNRFNISDHTKVVGYIGRLSKDKGINELVYAWELLKRDPLYNDTILILCGPDDDRDGLDLNTRTKISCETSIIQTGFVDETESIYSIFDIFVLPSYREGFPTVVLEASSMSLPVITTRSTGCVDSIINNYTGIYTDLTPNSIFSAIKYYLNNPLIAKEHGISGRFYVTEHFDQHVIWDQLHKKIYS